MKKEDWVVAAPVILTVEGFDFTVHNNGQHIVINYDDIKEFHLWPSTGKWRVRFKPHGSFRASWGADSLSLGLGLQGVRGLVRYLKER